MDISSSAHPPPTPHAASWRGWLPMVVLAGAGLHLALFFYVAVVRLAYPFELEQLEGLSVDSVRRLLSGQPFYTAPSLQFIPANYPPLYFAVSALVARWTGPSFWPVRLVSFAATLACFVLIVILVRQARAAGWAALAAAGLFAATFRLGASWLSLARVDALFLALTLAGAAALRAALSAAGRRRGLGHIAAGLLLALACLTKQSALLIALPLAAYALWADRRRGWLLGAAFGLPALAATLALNRASGGWYGYYVLTVALSHPLASRMWLDFWRSAVLAPLGLCLLAGAAFFALERRAGRPVGFWLTLSLALLGTSYWTRLHIGAAENDSIPAFAGLALAAGLGLDRAAAWAARAPRAQQAAAQALIGGLCLLQLALLAYNPLAQVPGAANRAAGQAVEQRVALTPGAVWLPNHGGLAGLAGKPASAHLVPISDVLDAGGPVSQGLQAQIASALRERRYAAILLDGPDFGRRFPELDQNYQIAASLPLGAAFYNIDGPRTLPEVVWVPKK